MRFFEMSERPENAQIWPEEDRTHTEEQKGMIDALNEHTGQQIDGTVRVKTQLQNAAFCGTCKKEMKPLGVGCPEELCPYRIPLL